MADQLLQLLIVDLIKLHDQTDISEFGHATYSRE